MTFESSNKETTASACHIRSACKRESDSKYFKDLFERQWDYFVIKPDTKTGRFHSHIECCGKLFETPRA
jgi:hypothetical protein